MVSQAPSTSGIVSCPTRLSSISRSQEQRNMACDVLLLAISLFSEQLGWWPPWSTPSISRQPGKYARLRATFSHTRLHFLCSPSLSSVLFNLVTQRDYDSKISQGPGSHSSSQMQKDIESQSGRKERNREKPLSPLC